MHTYFDVHILIPYNKSSILSPAYRKHKQKKHRAYKERVLEVEFTPRFFSTSGRMEKAATVVEVFSQSFVHPMQYSLSFNHGLATLYFEIFITVVDTLLQLTS